MAGIPPIRPYPMPGADELPDNTAGWTADPDRAVLLVHDMQSFFLRPFPAGQSPTEPLVSNSVRLRNQARALGLPIAYTAQPGDMTDQQRGLLKDFWGPGMRGESGDRQIIEPLAPAPTDWVFTKWRYSAFHHSDLLHRLRAAGRDQLIVCGVYAHVGVLMSSVEAFSNDLQVFLAADAVADFTPEYHRLAVSYAAESCAVVCTTDQILAQLDQRAALSVS